MNRGDFARRVAVVAVVVASLALVVTAGNAATAWPADRALVVEDAETGERLLEAPVENGTTVVLNYTHSVEKTRVLDVYEVRGDRLVMTRMEFESYGWGLPAGANVTKEDGVYVFDPDWAGDELYVTPGRVAGHELSVGDRTYDLVARSDARTVRIHLVRRVPLLDSLDVIS